MIRDAARAPAIMYAMRARPMLRTIASLSIAAGGGACAAMLGVDDIGYGSPEASDGASDATGEAPADAPIADGGPSDASPPDAAPDGGLAAKYRAAVLADQPLAYYRLADTSATGCKDEIDGAYTAVYAGNPIFSEPGIFADESDPAVRFRGAGVQVIAGADAAPLDFPHAAPFSLECWVKLDVDGGAGRNQVFNTLQPNVSNSPSLGSALFVWGPDALRFERWSDDALWAYAIAGSITLGAYHHVVVTINAAVPVIYVDGVANNGGDLSSPDEPPNSIPFVFGDLTGTLDEVALYDHVLSQGQVAAHFKAAK